MSQRQPSQDLITIFFASMSRLDLIEKMLTDGEENENHNVWEVFMAMAFLYQHWMLISAGGWEWANFLNSRRYVIGFIS